MALAAGVRTTFHTCQLSGGVDVCRLQSTFTPPPTVAVAIPPAFARIAIANAIRVLGTLIALAIATTFELYLRWHRSWVV